MAQYSIAYGGQVTVEATCQEEAYLNFYEVLFRRMLEGRLGLIVAIDGIEVSEDACHR